MAISYTICKVDKFENQQKYYVTNQTTLIGVEILPESYYEISDEFFSSVSVNGESCPVKKYTAFQDVRQNKHGRVANYCFSWYLEPHEFPMYYFPHYKLMILATGKNTVEAFLNQMSNDKESGFSCTRIDVNFKKIQSLLPIINGAWFAELEKKKQYLRSAGLFGHHVDKSEEFKAAAEAGVISSLSLPYSFNGNELQLSITRNGAIVFYNRIKNPVDKIFNIQSELSLAIDLYHKFIK